MSFTSDIATFVAKTKEDARDVFVGSVLEVHQSVVDGSTITGSQGVPKDTAYLAGTYAPEFPETWVGQVSSDAAYAKPIEDGEVLPHERREHQRTSVLGNTHTVSAHSVRGYKLSTPYPSGGGPHAIKLTRAGWQDIVEHVVVEVVR